MVLTLHSNFINYSQFSPGYRLLLRQSFLQKQRFVTFKFVFVSVWTITHKWHEINNHFNDLIIIDLPLQICTVEYHLATLTHWHTCVALKDMVKFCQTTKQQPSGKFILTLNLQAVLTL